MLNHQNANIYYIGVYMKYLRLPSSCPKPKNNLLLFSLSLLIMSFTLIVGWCINE